MDVTQASVVTERSNQLSVFYSFQNPPTAFADQQMALGSRPIMHGLALRERWKDSQSYYSWGATKSTLKETVQTSGVQAEYGSQIFWGG